MIDGICVAFTCTPSEALKQDPQLVFKVLEARAAKMGREYHRQDITKMPPELVKFWREFTNG